MCNKQTSSHLLITNSQQVLQASKLSQTLAKSVMVQNQMLPLFHADITLLVFPAHKGASVVQFVEFSLMILSNYINNELLIINQINYIFLFHF